MKLVAGLIVGLTVLSIEIKPGGGSELEREWLRCGRLERVTYRAARFERPIVPSGICCKIIVEIARRRNMPNSV